MAAAGALGQLGVQSIGQSIGYGISKSQLGDSYNIWKKSLKRGPTYRAIGLERAGINRIIAAGGGIQASSAGALLKSNQASGGTGSGNPAVDMATVNTAKAMQDKLLSEGDLARTRSELVGLEIPEATARALYFQTERGKSAAATRIETEANPKSLIQGGYQIPNWAEDLLNKFKSGNAGIVPRENR